MLFDVIYKTIADVQSQNTTNTTSVMALNQRVGEVEKATANGDKQKQVKDTKEETETGDSFLRLEQLRDLELGEELAALQEWTGKEFGKVVFDSSVDGFSIETLFDKARGKPNIMLIASTLAGDLFGVFYSVAATEHKQWSFDQKIFVFSLKSHGRCATPQRFVVKEKGRGDVSVQFWTSDNRGFVWFWVKNLWLLPLE